METQASSRRILFLLAAIFALPGIMLFAGQLQLDLAGFWDPGIGRLETKDFGNYWLGGRAVVEGRAVELFDPLYYQTLLQVAFPASNTARAWSYPPHYLFFIGWLGFLPYRTALVAFLGVTLLLFAITARWVAGARNAPLVLLLSLGFVLLNTTSGQNGFLIGSFVLAAAALAGTRPFLAGLCLACLSVKPQLGLLIPLVLVLEGRWRMFVGAALGTIALVGLSVAAFGVESWTGYLGETMRAQSRVMTDWVGVFLKMMPSVFAYARDSGYAPSTAILVHLPFAILALGLVAVTAWKKPGTAAGRVALYALATFVITPYAFVYDFGFVTVLLAAAFLARPEPLNLFSFAAGMAVLLASLLPVFWARGDTLPITPAMPIIALGLWSLWLYRPVSRTD